jgi:hypothetical protein
LFNAWLLRHPSRTYHRQPLEFRGSSKLSRGDSTVRRIIHDSASVLGRRTAKRDTFGIHPNTVREGWPRQICRRHQTPLSWFHCGQPQCNVDQMRREAGRLHVGNVNHLDSSTGTKHVAAMPELGERSVSLYHHAGVMTQGHVEFKEDTMIRGLVHSCVVSFVFRASSLILWLSHFFWLVTPWVAL